MPHGGPNTERVLILAPHGRDAEIASEMLREAGRHTHISADLTSLCLELEKGAAFALLAEEAIVDSDISSIASWVKDQPPWSDMPIVLMTFHGDTPGRVERAARYENILGNVTYLERPFHPTTLVSVARSAVRSRKRQYEARALLERYKLLARELQHRTKNLLAVIHAIASASLPAGAASEEFFGRLRALARAQDLLLEGDGCGASLKHLVAAALESFGRRVVVDGPEVHLDATTAQGFALILHELATNAAKHGALSRPTGTVTVQWSRDAGSVAALTFRWMERGGPPATLPKRIGFGTKLLEIAIPTVDAPPRFDYSADGFSYDLRVALYGATQGSSDVPH
jgi:two-component sensor histidine kinase